MTRELIERARKVVELNGIKQSTILIDQLATALEAAYDFMEAEADRMEES